MSTVWQWPPADLPTSTVWLGLHDCRSSVEGYFNEPRSGNLCSKTANGNCAIIEGLHPEARVRQPVAMSLKPTGISSPPPPVTCVCHTESKCKESNNLYFFSLLSCYFFQPDQFPGSVRYAFHKHHHQHKAGATKGCGQGLLDASERDLCETVWAGEHLAQEGDIQAW